MGWDNIFDAFSQVGVFGGGMGGGGYTIQVLISAELSLARPGLAWPGEVLSVMAV